MTKQDTSKLSEKKSGGVDDAAAATAGEKKVRRRRDMPSVAYMLKHGNPETAHLPKSKMEIYGYPIILALIFGISLLIFHHAPHHKSTHKGFQIKPGRGQQPQKMMPPQNQYQTPPVQEKQEEDPVKIPEEGEARAEF